MRVAIGSVPNQQLSAFLLPGSSFMGGTQSHAKTAVDGKKLRFHGEKQKFMRCCVGAVDLARRWAKC